MPDEIKSKKIQESLDNLDGQIVDLVGNYVKRRRENYEKAAKKLYANLKKDAKRYGELLIDKKIKQEDFDMLMQGRYAQLKIELLSELAMSKAKFNDIAGAVLKLTIKTVLMVI